MTKTNFIICADARTGSHLIQTAITQHPDVNCFGEILNPGSKDTFLKDGFTEIEAIKKAFNSDKKCNGFIVHRHRKNFNHVWNYLVSLKDLKVIVTHRENQLARYASLRIAKKTGKWISYSGDYSNEKIEFSEKDFEKQKERYNERLINAFQRFIEHQILQVNYEKLLSDYYAEMKAIYDFLGVDFMDFRPITVKQERRKLNEIFI